MPGNARRHRKDSDAHADAPPPVAPVADAGHRRQARPLAESLCDADGPGAGSPASTCRERGGRVMRLFIDKPGG
ncbi:MAG: hypothetical protein MZV70_07020 [Desulfobacterales bacterium]|nr:hypothetical protein [Desulfobacterales bacterium]